MTQQLLSLTLPNHIFTEFKVSYCNVEAYRLVLYQESWIENRLILLGEEKSGKSCLAHIWLKTYNALKVECFNENIYEINPKAILMEDIDKIQNEDDIFHTINYCNEMDSKLLLTGRQLPQFQIPDVKSRINATRKVSITTIDENLIRQLVERHFLQHQIVLDEEVIEYILVRVERRYTTVLNLLNRITAASLSQRRNITIPFLKKILDLNFEVV